MSCYILILVCLDCKQVLTNARVSIFESRNVANGLTLTARIFSSNNLETSNYLKQFERKFRTISEVKLNDMFYKDKRKLWFIR